MPFSPTNNNPVWDDGTWQPLPPLVGDTAADVCVIGLGTSGLCAVIEAANLGLKVVGIDSTCTAGGAAGANGGILRAGVSRFHHDAVQAFGRTRAAALYQLTTGEIARIVEETPDAVRRTGSLRVAADDAEWGECQLQLTALRADGITVEERTTAFGQGIFIPNDAAVQPLMRGRSLALQAIAKGARLFEQTHALGFTGNEVRTPGGRIHCGSVVVAVDGGLEDTVPALAGVVRTTRLQMLATEPAPDVLIPCPVSANGGFDYWQQLPDGCVALGGGRNRAFEDEWGAPALPSDEIQQYLDSVLLDRIRTSARVTHRWAARVAYTESGLPVLAEVAPNVWATGGYNGTGNLLGALCGRAAARLACGQSSELATLLAQPAGAAC